MENARLSSGKIACVVYMLAKMKAGTKKSVIKAHTIDWLWCMVCELALSELVAKKLILKNDQGCEKNLPFYMRYHFKKYETGKLYIVTLLILPYDCT